MLSIWQSATQINKRESLNHSISTDVAIIGGGMAGILAAYMLSKYGIESVVLEASAIASGQTGKSTAKITCQHAPTYAGLIKNLGAEAAKLYAKANQEAIDLYERIVADTNADCEFRRLPSYMYTQTDENTLLEEACAAKLSGIPSQYVHKTGLPFTVKAALRFDGQAQFDPVKFLAAVSPTVTVYENTSVQRVSGTTCITKRGDLRAKRVIFASNYPFMNDHGMYYARLHRQKAYVVAIDGVEPLDGMYYGMDSDGLSFRSCMGDKLLISGGSHRTGANPVGGKYSMLRAAAEQYYPGHAEVAHWSAEDCIPLDNMPYIGNYGGRTPNWYVATGFRKWGMTSSMVAAAMLTDLIVRKSSPYEKLFTPQRFNANVAMKPLMKQISSSAVGIGRRFFASAKGSFDDLPLGHGGIVEYNAGNGLEKLGVYKDFEGNVFAVSPQCPHMGCQLEWDPDDLAWECPCHGSRFDYTGKLVDNPAQVDLERYS